MGTRVKYAATALIAANIQESVTRVNRFYRKAAAQPDGPEETLRWLEKTINILSWRNSWKFRCRAALQRGGLRILITRYCVRFCRGSRDKLLRYKGK